jgi:DNA-binding ferritin-like protein
MVHITNKKKLYNKRKNKTSKHKKYTTEHIIKTFLQMLNAVKLYHWHTYSFPQHKATDELYQELNESIDKFVEIMLGKSNKRFGTLFTLYTNINNFTKDINFYKNYLINMHFTDANSDLMSIRDDILGHLNKYTYLTTLK